MRPAQIARVCILVVLFTFILGGNPGFAAPLAQDPVVNITSPTSGSTISGVVTITGTATHPNFSNYGLLYAAGPTVVAESQWKLIVTNVSSMVVNGPLGTWDTTQLPNGQYTLALVVYDTSNNLTTFYIDNLTISNEPPTATPEPTVPPEPTTETPGTDNPGGVVNPVATVEQPPTITPNPTTTVNPRGTTTPTGSANKALAISEKAITETACSGFWIAVMFYAAWGLYLGAKLAWRYSQRKPGGPKPTP